MSPTWPLKCSGGDLHDVVLVGHSYGGTVITMAAPRVRARLRGLVYVDATVPDRGRSNNDLLPPQIGALVRARDRTRRRRARPSALAGAVGADR